MYFDLAIVGAGPAGATCAAFCARAGLRTLLLERSVFPREKVCGDCLNPHAWPVLEALGLADTVKNLPHSPLHEVEFLGLDNRPIRVSLKNSSEIAIKRSLLDQALLRKAAESGAHVIEGQALTSLAPGWVLQTGNARFQAKHLVAADGRNSSVARILGLLPPAFKDRVALQTHIPITDSGFAHRVRLQFRPEGYCGVAPVGDGLLNLCLVSRPLQMPALKTWAQNLFSIPDTQDWRTITPLERAPASPRVGNLLLVGDAARVVEPFTGEGIYYALRSGQLAAQHLIAGDLDGYPKAHAALYSGRLWVNQLSKAAVLSPRLATLFLRAAQPFPWILRGLTSKVIPG